jgi:ligand-binding sensor domain-containing protein/signal transduction histidine kinase
MPFTFTRYTMSTGLLSNEVRSVVQDRTGYLWIGSNNGLQRFDGVHYKTFQHRDNDPASLPGNFVIQLLLDNNDQLWVVLSDGQVGRFDKSKFTYTPVAVKPQRQASLWAIKRLIKDDTGHLFFLMESAEVLTYDPIKAEFSAAANFFSLKPDMVVTALAKQPGTQKYWIGLRTGGVAIYNQQTKKLSDATNNVEKEPAVDSLKRFPSITNFSFDGQGRFWFVSWINGYFPSIIQFNSKSNSVRIHELLTRLKTYHEIEGFLEEKGGRVWVYGTGVLGYYNETKKEFALVPSEDRTGLGIIYDHIYTMLEDRERNIWAVTGNYGMFRCNPAQQYFGNVLHISQENGQSGTGSILSFIETNDGHILAGAWGDGLYRYNKRFEEVPLKARFTNQKRSMMFWSMAYSGDSNTIWMGCQPGVAAYRQKEGILTSYNPAPLQNRTVRQIAEDSRGNLWLGMHHFGLFKWTNPHNGKDSLLKIPEIGNDLVTKVVADQKGFVWVTTEKKGIYAFDAETDQIRFHWNNRSEADSMKIIEGFTGLLLHDDSTVLFSTSSRLYQFNRYTNQLRQVQLPAALLGGIAAIEKDNEDFLWISTANGLYRYHMQKKVLVFFNREDGILNDRFIMAASYRMKDGRLLFGVDNAFIYFDPAKVRFGEEKQRVVLTGLQVGKRDLPIDSISRLGALVLGPNDNPISIEFSSLSFAASSLVQYMLQGIDKEWHTADKDKKASFPFLPPKKYTLLLRTVNAEGVASEPTELKIVIKSPFYQTWWFYSLLAIVLAAFLLWFDKQRAKRKAVLQKVRTDIADGLHQEVNTALNNINILSEIARLKSEREPQKAREYLEQIHDKSHNMIIALDDMLWSLDPDNDAMDKTVVRIREFADALMQRTGAVIELLIDKKVERLQLNMKLRHEAFLLFKEGLRSLIDAGTRHCVVHLAAERGRLLFTIEFETEHCHMVKLNNLLQRRDLEDRLEALNAKLDVQMHKSRSVFMLQLPL